MLSKSKGQVLRVAATLHFLFNINSPSSDQQELSDEISEDAILASINFVSLCCQQTAFMAGCGNITEEIQLIKESMRCFILHIIMWTRMHPICRFYWRETGYIECIKWQ